ncbi:MAG: hypothetical protein ACT4PI_06660 [Actinomycetota bacterium]
MHARRITRLAAAAGVGALAFALGSGPALAGGEPPEDGLITADDLSGDWEEGPPEEDDENASLDEAAEEIDACQGILKISDKVEKADKADGSTFELDGQTIESTVGVVGKKTAKRAVSAYASGDAADCFAELLTSNPVAAEADVEAESGEGPDIGDDSAILAASVSGEDESTGGTLSFSFQVVIVRVGGTLALYGYENQDGGANEDEFADALAAAGERLEEAA